MTLANNGTGFEGCRCFLLRNKILEEDFPNEDNYGNWFPFNAQLYFMYLIFGIQNLLKQKYVKEADAGKLADLGFKQEAVIRGIESAGINLQSLNLDTTNTNAIYLLSMQTPLLITARSFMAFSRMFYSTFLGFKQCLIMLLKQIPTMILVKIDNQSTIVPMDMAQIFGLIDAQWEWQFTINGVQYLYDAPDTIKNTSNQFKSNIRNIINTVMPNIFETLLIKKCYKNYSKRLTDGFFVINTFQNNIEWINGSEDLWTPWTIENVLSKIRDLIKTNMINKNIPNLDNINVFNPNVAYEDKDAILGTLVNPFSIFGSLPEDDFKQIGTLLGSFVNVFKNEFGVKNETTPFLGALIRFCYSTEKTPEVIASSQEILGHFNELISRKIFAIQKLTNTTYIQSSKDYIGCYIIPMQLSTYKIKWYLKRDFLEFFRFFDNVYFKPEYLRMLSPEGIAILKKLSTFDAKVLDALTLTINN